MKNIIDIIPPESTEKLDQKTVERLINLQSQQSQEEFKKERYYKIFSAVFLLISVVHTPFIAYYWYKRLADPYLLGTPVEMYFGSKLEIFAWILIVGFVIYAARIFFTQKGILMTNALEHVNLEGLPAQIYGFMLLAFGLAGYYFLFIRIYTPVLIEWIQKVF